MTKLLQLKIVIDLQHNLNIILILICRKEYIFSKNHFMQKIKMKGNVELQRIYRKILSKLF